MSGTIIPMWEARERLKDQEDVKTEGDIDLEQQAILNAEKRRKQDDERKKRNQDVTRNYNLKSKPRPGHTAGNRGPNGNDRA